MEYSPALYYDYANNQLVQADYTPYKLPRIPNTLHGGELGLDSPADDSEKEKHEESSKSKFIKYKGLQLKDDLSVTTFQRFKAEWEAYLTISALTKKQKKEQLVDRAIAGNAKLIASQAFKDQFGAANDEQILQFLENKISAHLGLRGKAGIIKRIQQNTKEESLINLFLELDLAFASRPNATEEDKILAAFEAIKSTTLANNIAKREREFEGDWIKFQQIASEEWGFMGGKDTEPDQTAKLQSQLNTIREQSIQMVKEHQRIIQHQNDQINVISQNSSRVSKCYKCGRIGHRQANCQTRNLPAPNQAKKICQFHGENYSHTSAECTVLNKQNQPRGIRQPRKVYFDHLRL